MSNSTPNLAVTTIAIDELRPDPNNARKHGRQNLAAIRSSLERFGQRRPLVVLPDLTVIAGNGTLEAAKSLGWSTVAITTVPDTWTVDEARAYAIADNRTAELATWDEAVLQTTLADLNGLGWDLNNLGFDGLPSLTTRPDVDSTPPVPSDPVAKLGDVWLLGNHRVVCGSSTDPAAVAKLLDGQPLHAVLTDPPYGVAYTSNGAENKHRKIANDALADDALLDLVRDALKLANVATVDGGPCYVFHSPGKHEVFKAAFTSAGYFFHQPIIWVKDRIVLSRLDYHPQHEFILYGWKPGGRHSWFGGRKRSAVIGERPNFSGMTHEELVELLTDLYDGSDIVLHDRPGSVDDHPTMKPVGLLVRLLLASTKKGQTVYDPFLGSGSTLLACEIEGRTCYGVELDPGYVDVIIRRWENHTGQKAVRA